MKTENITLQADGFKLAASVDFPDEKERFKFIVGCHGLFSTKDSEKWLALGQKFAGAGYGLLRLDFRGCGESEGLIEDCTLSGRLNDLEAALTYIKEHPAFTPPMGLVGSSLGGILAAIKAAGNREVGALAVMATPVRVEASPEVQSSLREKGYYQYDPEFRLKKDFWEHAEQYHLSNWAVNIACPTLIIHGDEDEQVPLENARILFESLISEKQLEIIAGGDHRFSDPVHRERVIDLIVNWVMGKMAP